MTGDGGFASGLGNIPDQSKLSQTPNDQSQKYPDQSEKNTHLRLPEKSDPSSHQQQFNNFGLLENPGPQINRPDQFDQSAHSSYLPQSSNPANFWQPNQPVLFGESNGPQQHSYNRETQLTNNDGKLFFTLQSKCALRAYAIYA